MADVLISEIPNEITSPASTGLQEMETAANVSGFITLENLGKFYLRNRSHLRVASSGSRHKTYADVVCDGTADQDSIMSAMADVPVGGGVVELLDGEFVTNAPIIWDRDNVTLRGQGAGDRKGSSLADTDAVGTRIRAASDFSGSDIIKIYREDETRPVAQTKLLDFVVDGDSIAGPINGINILSFRNIVSRVSVYECTGYGIYVAGLNAWNPYDCYYNQLQLAYNDLDGLHFAQYSPDAHMAQIICHTNGQDGLSMLGASHQVVGIHTYNNTRNGIRVAGGSVRHKIVNWKCEQSGQHGLFVTGATGGVTDLQVVAANFKNNGATTDDTYDHIYLEAGGASVLRSNFTNIVIASTSPANEARYGVNISGAAVEDTRFTDLQINTSAGTFATAAINDAGRRSVINGVSVNAGDPASAGNWNGVAREGAIVRDTGSGTIYINVRGSWHTIA